jgi:hypothetical protein
MLNFNKVRNKEISINALCRELTVEDLHRLTDEMIDHQLELIADADDADVVFVPLDPEAYDTYADQESVVNLAWTLGHVIVHVTASSEESAAQAANLARGVVVEGRMRYEIPWETVATIEQVRQRLEGKPPHPARFLKCLAGQTAYGKHLHASIPQCKATQPGRSVCQRPGT